MYSQKDENVTNLDYYTVPSVEMNQCTILSKNLVLLNVMSAEQSILHTTTKWKDVDNVMNVQMNGLYVMSVMPRFV